MNLYNLLQSSFTAAQQVTHSDATMSSRRTLHPARSRAWVSQLAKQLKLTYEDDSTVRVLSKYQDIHRAEFGLNELLYDVLACRVDTTPSAAHQKPLTYVTEVLWQIESEFARNSREALFDFNKLVLGAAQNKLFVGPQVRDAQVFINTLLRAAQYCTGNVYMALVPHPESWDEPTAAIDLWQYRTGQWEPLTATN
jgi:hypothetical protein